MESLFNIKHSEEDLEKENITYWIKDFREHEEMNNIIETKAFNRLHDISFLGAIDYSDKSELSKIDRNRAIHSLYVAGIANFIATERKYDEELKKHIVAAALLHDIGHIPLSHSAEPYIKSRFGYGHHEIGNDIISGCVWKNSGLNNILSKNFDIAFIKQLLNNETNNDGSDIFSSKINADTIDGIIRCVEYKGINRTNSLNRISIARSFFIKDSCYSTIKRLDTLDSFWKTKHFVYQNYINTKHGVISDKLSQVFFMEIGDISVRDLLSKESTWKGKYKTLFKWLSELKDRNIPSCLKGYEIEYTTRKYEVLKSEKSFDKRYINSKQKNKISLDNYMEYNLINTRVE
ncbi:HD domain-containing protein [Pectobacterium brasiliense]|uniref:HD domain-containing protein n=1 Tax=Pectobacterium brasiliense TaxID=180957 RepID=UPI00193D6980|nr:HD domain-containing protein [Pectobacterium brasiliense]QRN35756.1 HD domain-containing protein [Pectobacterium brasiliense]